VSVRTITHRAKAHGVKLRHDVDKFAVEAAEKYFKRVCERAEEFEKSGEPADVISRASILKCSPQRIDLQACLYASFRDQAGGDGSDLDAFLGRAQELVDFFERDLDELLLVSVVEFRVARIADA
jgi:hypothetical protein